MSRKSARWTRVLFVAVLLTVTCGTTPASAFDWKTDCVGRFSLELPGAVEVAMSVYRAFEKPEKDPKYPTEAVIAFLQRGGALHFMDGEETSGYTGGTTWGSTQSVGEWPVALQTGPKADADEFARFSRAMDSYFEQDKTRLEDSDFKRDVERASRIAPVAPEFFDTHAWRRGSSVYYLLWRDHRLFSLFYREDNPDSRPTPQYVSDHIRSRDIFQVPKEAGLCLHEAFLPDDGTLPRSIAVTYRLKDHPEIEIYFSDNYTHDEKSPVDKVVKDFWETMHPIPSAKKIELISRHFPGIVHFPGVEIAGYTGKRSFVEITNKDDTIDYGYFAYVRGDPNAKEDRPYLMLYVISNNAKATGTPLSKREIEEIADHIAASVKRRGQAGTLPR